MAERPISISNSIFRATANNYLIHEAELRIICDFSALAQAVSENEPENSLSDVCFAGRRPGIKAEAGVGGINLPPARQHPVIQGFLQITRP